MPEDEGLSTALERLSRLSEQVRPSISKDPEVTEYVDHYLDLVGGGSYVSIKQAHDLFVPHRPDVSYEAFSTVVRRRRQLREQGA